MYNFNIYDYLCEDAYNLRTEVFINEQGFKDEFDDIDFKARHIVLYDLSRPIGCLRYYYDDSINSYVIGRICIIKEYRDKHLGSMLVSKAEEEIKIGGSSNIRINAQVKASGFYNKLGYNAFGDIYLDEGCPHIRMNKEI